MRNFVSRTALALFDRTQDDSSIPARLHEVGACSSSQAPRRITPPLSAARTRARWAFLAKTASFVMIVVALFASPSGAAHAKSASTMKPAIAPAADPFASFIAEASQRFGISAHWIRAVMRIESAGRPHTVSPKGAMGLMQIMPKTWTELRARYRLGADPYDPRNNILAGAAYLRELHNRYGAPGFLAAYNAGPGRYERHLATGRPLPAETRGYVAKLEPMLNSNGVSNRSTVASGVPTWRQATPFVVRTNHNPAGDRPSSAVQLDRASKGRAAVDLSAIMPQSTGLFVQRAREARSK